MSDTIEVTEIFKSVQGESSLTGLPTTFVRLSRCNLRCSWCDTCYAFSRGNMKAIPDIIEEVKENAASHVCITGGEPLLQENVYPLMTQLCDLSYQLSIETGGSLDISRIDQRVKVILDIKCPASGMCPKNHMENLTFLKKEDEVKFVIADRDDYLFAVKTCEKFGLFKKVNNVLFSCVYDSLEPKELVNWILQDNLNVRLNLQVHKYIWSPETKGV